MAKVTHLIWWGVTAEQKATLPTETEISLPNDLVGEELNDYVAIEISDKYGACLESFCIDF